MLARIEQTGIAGNDYKFELAPFDFWSNPILTLTDDDMNVNIMFPDNLIFGEDSYDITKNDNNGTFFYFVHAKTAGLYTIYCDLLTEDYTF